MRGGWHCRAGATARRDAEGAWLIQLLAAQQCEVGLLGRQDAAPPFATGDPSLAVGARACFVSSSLPPAFPQVAPETDTPRCIDSAHYPRGARDVAAGACGAGSGRSAISKSAFAASHAAWIATNASTGTPNASTGAFQVITGTIQVMTGTTPVTTGATPVTTGTIQVTTGASPVMTGTIQVTTGASPVMTGTTQVMTGVTPVMTGVVPAHVRFAPAASGAAPLAPRIAHTSTPLSGRRRGKASGKRHPALGMRPRRPNPMAVCRWHGAGTCANHDPSLTAGHVEQAARFAEALLFSRLGEPCHRCRLLTALRGAEPSPVR